MFVSLCVCPALVWSSGTLRPRITGTFWQSLKYCMKCELRHTLQTTNISHTYKTHTRTKTAILRQNLWKQCSVFFRLKQNGEHDKQVAEKQELVWHTHWTPNQISLNMPRHHSSPSNRKKNGREGGGVIKIGYEKDN